MGPFSVERLATDVAVVSPQYVQEGSEINTYYNGELVATAAIIIFSSAKHCRRSQLAGWLSWLRRSRLIALMQERRRQSQLCIPTLSH